jgi:hypothetical protein
VFSALLAGTSVSAAPAHDDARPLTTTFPPARSPTSASSERSVSKAEHSEPWKQGSSTTSPYQYHPGGDTSIKKDAPSALNVVVIPNVTLPKVRFPSMLTCCPAVHPLTLCRSSTTHTTSGARTDTRFRLYSTNPSHKHLPAAAATQSLESFFLEVLSLYISQYRPHESKSFTDWPRCICNIHMFWLVMTLP